MILVLGGTTEGRKAVETLDKAGKTFFYSTKSDLQKVVSLNAVRITGGLDSEAMSYFCQGNNIRLIVDASHPFASKLHATVKEVSSELSIPVIRYERHYQEHDQRIIWCDDFDDAVAKLHRDKVKRLLALTGVQTIPELKGYWKDNECRFRILNREESIDKAMEARFPKENLCFYDNTSNISDLILTYHPDAIIMKESGESGGFDAKVAEAFSYGIKVYAVCRPPLPDGFITVSGEYGLRKSVEKLLPGFYELRSGFTTGACATAAAKAALLAIVNDEEPEWVSFSLPNGEDMCMKVTDVNIIENTTAEAVVIKDAGDDPDVTDGCQIVAKVTLADHGDIHFYGGEGIGIVTLPGIGLKIGEPAINPVPRQMIKSELLQIYPLGCDVTISVPGGEELAKRTFNSRIGIIGGISIIGTSGIIMPFSNEAFLEAICREMEVAKALGCERVVLNSGARSEKVVKKQYPELSAAAFVHYGNAIGESLEIASDLKIEKLTVGLMLGKAVKLAEGNTDTHSRKVAMNRDFLIEVARRSGCSPDARKAIRSVNMARELWTSLTPDDSEKFFPHLLQLCHNVCRTCYTHGELTLMLITDDDCIFCRK